MTSFADPGTPSGGGDTTRTANVVLNADVTGYSQAMSQAAQQTGLLSSSVSGLKDKLAGFDKWAGKKLFQFSAADFALLSGATADAATFQKQLSTLAATSAVTGTSFKGLKAGVEDAFTSFGTSRGQVVALVETISNLGVTATSSISSLTRTFIKLGAATGEPIQELASGLIQLSRVMGSTDATQIGNYANALLTVSKNAGVSATGVASFAQSIAPVARQAGIGEGAVIGISTAFTKAGADGLVAGNTFNSMLSDITNAIASGSPQLAKYANLIGVTQDQFRKMDKSNAIVAIFNQITAMGPKAINLLNDLGITGTRAQSAIAAVSQSGGLQKYITEATNAQSGQGNLNKGAHAAMDNLGDSLARARNQFTQMGAEIGAVFLGPMTIAVNAVDHLAHSLNALVRPLAPIIGAMAAVAGSIGLVGGAALNVAGIIGAGALVRTITRGRTVGGFGAGVVAARTVAAGPEAVNAANERAAAIRAIPMVARSPIQRRFLMQHEAAAAYNRGELTGLPARGFEGGVAFGTRFSGVPSTPTDPGSLRLLSTWRNMGIAAIPRAIAFANREQGRFLQQSRQEGFDRVQAARLPFRQAFTNFRQSVGGLNTNELIGQESRGLLGSAGELGRGYIVAGAGMAATAARRAAAIAGPRAIGSMVGSLIGLPGAGSMGSRLGSVASRQDFSANVARIKASASEVTQQFSSVARTAKIDFGALAVASKDLVSAFSKATLGVISTGLGRGLGVAGSVASAVGSRALGVARGVASRAFSLPGIIGIEAGTALYHHVTGNADRAADNSRDLNPIQAYNNQLGIATTRLATFGNELSTASGLQKTLNGVTSTTVPKTAAEITSTDITNAATAKNKDANIKAVHKNAGEKGSAASAALTELAQSYSMTDPKQLQLFKANALAAGFKPDVLQPALDAAAAQMTGTGEGPQPYTDYFKLGDTINKRQGIATGILSPLGSVVARNIDPGSKKIRQSAVTGIKVSGEADQLHGSAYAEQRKFASSVSLLAGEYLSKGKGTTSPGVQEQETAEAAASLTGGDADSLRQSISDAGQRALDAGRIDANKPTTKLQAQKIIIDALEHGSSKKARNYVKTLKDQGINVEDPKAFAEAIKNFFNQGIDSAQYKALQNDAGPAGQFLTNSKTVQAAIDKPGTPSLGRAAMLAAYKASGGGTGTSVNNLGLAEALSGDPTQGYGLVAAEANAYARQKQDVALQGGTREQQLGAASQRYQGSMNALRLAGRDAPAETVAQAGTDETALDQSKASYTDWLKQTYVQFKAFKVSMERSAEDMYDPKTGQIARSQEDFQTSMTNSADDYSKARLRNEADYATQARHAQEDFLRARDRAQQDHDRALANQAAAAAQAIYNPYLRIQAKYTTDSESLMQNLVDQNKAIDQQRAQVAMLHKRGLSTQAIQVLDLANPENAQQTNTLAGQMTAKQIAEANDLAKKRVAGTAALTQNAYNMQFAQGEQAFRIDLSRTAKDFALNKKRADQQQSLSLSRMAEDYSVSVSRANDAQARGLKRLGEDYGKMTKRAGEDLATSVAQITGNFGTAYAQMLALVTGKLAKFAPGASKIINTELKTLKSQYPELFGVVPPPPQVKPTGAPSYGPNASNPGTQTHTSSGPTAPPKLSPRVNAIGGIATKAEYGVYGEAGPEALIPLNERGQAFMAGLIARALSQGVTMAYRGAQGGDTTTTIDQSTSFNGAKITVMADDPNRMARELQAKEKLRRLASPVRHR